VQFFHPPAKNHGAVLPSLASSVKNLLMTEGLNRTLSSGKNLEDGIRSIESISDYKEQIAKNGVFAIEVQPHSC